MPTASSVLTAYAHSVRNPPHGFYVEQLDAATHEVGIFPGHEAIGELPYAEHFAEKLEKALDVALEGSGQREKFCLKSMHASESRLQHDEPSRENEKCQL